MSKPRRLPSGTPLEQLGKQAEEVARDTALPLAEARFQLAGDYGFETWAKLKHHIKASRPGPMAIYERLAETMAIAYATGDADAIRNLNFNEGTSFVHYHEPEKMQQRLRNWFAAEIRTPELALSDAKKIVAYTCGFDNWREFEASVTAPAADPRSASIFRSSTPPFYRIDRKANEIHVGGAQTSKGWDTVFAVMKEQGIAGFHAGAMEDSAMKQLAKLSKVTRISLGGNAVTDRGLQALAHMPQLRDLDFGGWTSPITDSGLEVLSHLTELRNFKSCWTQGITDAGLAALAACHHLEEVNLMGTLAGDGTLQALSGKPRLSRLNTGRGVSDEGIRLLHEFPVFKTWQGGEVSYGLMRADSGPNNLMIDGPFTNEGLRGLTGLDGLFGLSFFWHSPSFTGAAIEHLRYLPRLGMLGCQDQRCDDEAMRHIANLPNLRMLMAQGAVATDEGWETLSHSQTIEHIWGRECPNLTGHGFRALSRMPSLQGLAVSCAQVDDDSLALLPDFPMLRELVPMEFTDAGFRHIGLCHNLERLICMYCRETGDDATGHLQNLRLKRYYAGSTKITDLSLAVLGAMASLEQLEFWECVSLTDAGMAHLSRLPNLQEVKVDGFCGITKAAASLFAPGVKINF